MNVVGARPDGWWRDRTAAMRRLARQLERFAADRGARVEVVFDGRERDLGTPGVEVAFASAAGAGAADAEIARRVEAEPEPARLRVVTSDRALAARVAALGAEVVGAASFRRQLDELDPPDG